VDLERDILAQMEFRPAIADDLKPMPAEIFNATWGGLRQIIVNKKTPAAAPAPDPVLV
jgi:propionate CoA-transferase